MKATKTTSNDAGFTLIEMVVVLALFATVALIGVQALRMSLRFQEQLTTHAETADTLASALALLRSDLEASFSFEDGPVPGTVVLTLARADNPDALGQRSVNTVFWRHDRVEQILSREQRAVDATGRTHSVPILRDVTTFDVRLLTSQGWQSIGRANDLEADAEPPQALEARLDTQTGPLRVLVVP